MSRCGEEVKRFQSNTVLEPRGDEGVAAWRIRKEEASPDQRRHRRLLPESGVRGNPLICRIGVVTSTLVPDVRLDLEATNR